MSVIKSQFNSSPEIGVFAILTNTYSLIPFNSRKHFVSLFETVLKHTIPIIQCSIASSHTIGSFAAGNSKGLLLPATATNQEIQYLREQLPDDIIIERVDDNLSCLGNSIACNDKVAIVNPEFDPATLEIISDVLGVESISVSIADENLVGSYCVLSNQGGVVSEKISQQQLDEISSQIGIELIPTSINNGSLILGSGICVNDKILFCGIESIASEISKLTRIFKIEDVSSSEQFNWNIFEKTEF
jgi:translation initiation factor 6